MNVLMISNIDNDEKLEDIWIARAFQEDGHKVAIVGNDYDERLDNIFDIFLQRNTWFSEGSKINRYNKLFDKLLKRLKEKNLPRINFDGKFDGTDKTYLVDLFKTGYSVVPSVDNLADIDLLPNADTYLLKPKEGYDGIGQLKLNKEALLDKFDSSYIIQPLLKFKSEIQFYFIKNQIQYALEFVPSKVPVYPDAKKYLYSDEELNLAKKFAELNGDYYGIQRIDFLKLEDDSLLLLEIEDVAPYLDLDCLEQSEIYNFIQNYKNMVYDYLENFNKFDRT